MEKSEINRHLKKIYFNPSHSASFGGVEKLFKAVKSEGLNISRGDIRSWLKSQNNHVLFRAVRRKFSKRKVVVPRKFYQFDADTINMTRYRKDNKGYNYIFVAIDVLSRFAWTSPLKTLTGQEMKSCLRRTLTVVPTKLRTDGGSEFINRDVTSYLKSKNIESFQTLNSEKANFAERLIKSLKSKIVKYMKHRESPKWVDVLPLITQSYNETFHRSLGMTPKEALNSSDSLLWRAQYGPVAKSSEKRSSTKSYPRSRSYFKFKVGDTVKLSHAKSPFTREYDERWTNEYFTVTSRNNKQNIPMYTVKDWSNDPIRGSFYGPELQKVSSPEKDAKYKIEKIIKTRKRNGRKELFVKWLGWHRKFNSWVEESKTRS